MRDSVYIPGYMYIIINATRVNIAQTRQTTLSLPNNKHCKYVYFTEFTSTIADDNRFLILLLPVPFTKRHNKQYSLSNSYNSINFYILKSL